MAVRGIVTPAVTPLKGGELSREGAAALLEFIKGSGASGVFPMGSTGMAPAFSKAAHIRAIELFSELLPPGMSMFAGVSRNNYEETLEVARTARDMGAEYLVVVTPYYIRRSQEDLYRYYVSLASAVDSKIIVYSIPQLTGAVVEPETLFRIAAEASNVAGIKDSSGDMRLFSRYVYGAPRGFAVYQGQDDLLAASIAIGASGGVCGTSNLVDWTVRLWKGEVRLAPLISELMRILSGFDFPKAYYYLFWKNVVKEEPRGYLPGEMAELSEEERRRAQEGFERLVKEAEGLERA